MLGANSGAGTAYPVGAPQLSPVFSSYCSILSFQCSVLLIIVCTAYPIFFILAIVCVWLPFGIFFFLAYSSIIFILLHVFTFRVRVMVLDATFKNISVISWRSALLMEESVGTLRKPPTCRKSLTNFYHINVVSSTPCLSGIQTHNFSGDRHWLHR